MKTVFDVGAAWGDMTMRFHRAFPKARIYAFEPQSRSYPVLARRATKYEQIIPIKMAVSYVTGTNTLHLYKYATSTSLLPIQEYMTHANDRIIGEEQVPTTRLDDFCRSKGIDHIDFLKIDVEGAELEVLIGARMMLKQTDNVFIEINPLRKGPYSASHIDIFTRLYEAGFVFLGWFNDFWLSRDEAVLRYFGLVGREEVIENR